MAKVTKFSESASDSLQISASANEKGIEIIKSVADFYKAVPMTTSLNVANIFGKQHKHVLRDVNYPRTKDSWASDFTEECPFKRLGLLSSPSV